MPAVVKNPALEDQQDQPVIKVVGKIGGSTAESDGSNGTKYLLHAAWNDKTYEVSARGLKVLRGMDIRVIDNPSEYTI
jgi:hypothetical protein